MTGLADRHRESPPRDAAVKFQMDAAAEPGRVLPVLVRLLIALNQQRQAEVLSEQTAGEEDRQD